jgi:hypothetical protein
MRIAARTGVQEDRWYLVYHFPSKLGRGSVELCPGMRSDSDVGPGEL